MARGGGGVVRAVHCKHLSAGMPSEVCATNLVAFRMGSRSSSTG
jgi:hypothetical protein